MRSHDEQWAGLPARAHSNAIASAGIQDPPISLPNLPHGSVLVTIRIPAWSGLPVVADASRENHWQSTACGCEDVLAGSWAIGRLGAGNRRGLGRLPSTSTPLGRRGSSMKNVVAAVEATSLFRQFATAHAGVEAWPDEGFTEGGAGPTPGSSHDTAVVPSVTWPTSGCGTANSSVARMIARAMTCGCRLSKVLPHVVENTIT
jgi:hypothetical protein